MWHHLAAKRSGQRAKHWDLKRIPNLKREISRTTCGVPASKAELVTRGRCVQGAELQAPAPSSSGCDAQPRFHSLAFGSAHCIECKPLMSVKSCTEGQRPRNYSSDICSHRIINKINNIEKEVGSNHYSKIVLKDIIAKQITVFKKNIKKCNHFLVSELVGN